MEEKKNRPEMKKRIQKVQDGKTLQPEGATGFEAKRMRNKMENRKRDGDKIWKRMMKECKR